MYHMEVLSSCSGSVCEGAEFSGSNHEIIYAFSTFLFDYLTCKCSQNKTTGAASDAHQ